MALEIIGSGFGRTGTMSTKLALEALGFGPCHHMVEVLGNPGQAVHWAALARGEEVDWADVFEGYRAQVDNPGAVFWHELSIAFPEAKVIHTERPEDEWWESYSQTINKFWMHRKGLALPAEVQAVLDSMDRILGQGGEAGLDRDSAIRAYRRNNEKVRDTIGRDRLLVFTPSEGWDPLCRFLGVPVPGAAFPRSNARVEFWAMFGGEPAAA
ncbi:sulfotransferase family protein [Ovoidimarina sediminis]|uniref:sulfotransferase family protein n=1 Tax=Ovoidimarina sediminis TaxID=3079856 RepID=UPI00290A7243|nr:sulfotransferase [Rhodophyticola sp. MJ-SS7]MDU8942393.1 sulfotransferase [Rhodophyticola sp. MJ-SS7]